MNRRKFLSSCGVLSAVALSGCMSAPHASDQITETHNEELVKDDDYKLYITQEWNETHEHVIEETEHGEIKLDLGTRVQDGSMHIHVSADAPQSNYKMSIDSIKKESEDDKIGLFIDANVESKEDDSESENVVGSTVITTVDKNAEMLELKQTDLDFVEVEITDGWGQTGVLRRDACGCALSADPKPDND